MKWDTEKAGQPLDDRAGAYRRSGNMIAAIARRHNHLDIDEQTEERWRQLMGLMREVDTWADDTDATRDDVLSGLINSEMFRDRYPDLAPGELSVEAHLALLRRTNHILRVGELASREVSPRRFMVFRIIEARETVNMFGDTATAHVAEQPGFREEFLPTPRALGEAATLWDSLIDGRQDVRAGKQVLRPNPEYYARLTGAMLRRVKLGGAALLHFEPNKHIAAKVGERVTNRVKNGIPSYSTLGRLKLERDRIEK
jgi:hypothetical protein